MPSQLRRMIRQLGRDLHAEFCALLPEQPPPIRIQRWTVRRVGLLIGAVLRRVIAAVVVIQLLGSPL